MKIADTLYHYTTATGLLGILKSGKLRASSIHHLNDWREYSHGLDLLLDALDHFESEDDPVADSIKGILRDVFDKLRIMPVYVFCMSQDGDSLSQWRAYSEEGSGFAIGFETDALRKLAAEQGFRLLACTYSGEPDDVLKAHVQVLIESQRSNMESEPRDVGVNKPREPFADHFVDIVAALKDPAFREEREIRLVSRLTGARDERIGFRKGRSTIIPYLDLDLRKGKGLPISSFTVGPTREAERELASHSVRTLMYRYGLDEAELQFSDAPYRVP